MNSRGDKNERGESYQALSWQQALKLAAKERKWALVHAVEPHEIESVFDDVEELLKVARETALLESPQLPTIPPPPEKPSIPLHLSEYIPHRDAAARVARVKKLIVRRVMQAIRIRLAVGAEEDNPHIAKYAVIRRTYTDKGAFSSSYVKSYGHARLLKALEFELPPSQARRVPRLRELFRRATSAQKAAAADHRALRDTHQAREERAAYDAARKTRDEIRKEVHRIKRLGHPRDREIEEAHDAWSKVREVLQRRAKNPEHYRRLYELDLKKGLVRETRKSHVFWRAVRTGAWTMADVRRHLRSQKPQPGQARLDESRFKFLESMLPRRCWLGEQQWEGYVVFDFDYSRRLVLECPRVGNAVYVIDYGWKQFSTLTKSQLFGLQRAGVTRIVHQGNWKGRLRRALGAR